MLGFVSDFELRISDLRPGCAASRSPSTWSAFELDCRARHLWAPFVTLTTLTIPPLLRRHRLSKEKCPYTEGVERWAVRPCQLGATYENLVNSQVARLDPPPLRRGRIRYFHASQLWRGHGEHVPGSRFLCRHRESSACTSRSPPGSTRSGIPC